MKAATRGILSADAEQFPDIFTARMAHRFWSNYSPLITLSGNYAAATNYAQRSAYVAAANYASAVLTYSTEAVYSVFVLSFGILMIGLVMLKGIFSKSTAYLGLVTGTLGIVSVAPLFHKNFRSNHNNHRLRSHHSLGLVCELQARSGRA